MLKHLPVFDEFHRVAVNNAPTHKHPADAEKRRWEQQVKDAMRVLGVVLAREDDTTVAPEAPVSLVLCEHLFAMLGALDYSITKKKHPHGSLIKDSIATKMKGYLFKDAFPKRIVNKIFDNSIS